MSTSSGQSGAPRREELIESHLPLVRAIAGRYAGRGETFDDLVQVGAVALVRASDRFDPDRGVAFATFAAPAIEGEIRRHLGDRTGVVHIPRELQRISGELARSRTELGAELGRRPTVDELATALGLERTDVERALEAERAREPMQSPPGDVAEGAGASASISSSEDRMLLARGARVLDERERRIVFLRFHADMTEREIAGEVGVSQSHVSRLLTRALAKLRGELADRPGDSGEGTDLPAGDKTRIATVGGSERQAGVAAGAASRAEGRQAAQAQTRQQESLALPYHVTVKQEEGAASGWTAALDELPGCEARGATPEEAIEGLRSAMETWLSAAVEDRRVISPRKRRSKGKPASSHSGRFLVRMPGDLHQELAQAAERENVSLNRYVTSTLAASVSPADTTAPPSGGQLAVDTPPVSATPRRRNLRMLLAANIVLIVVAAAAAIALVILALERGI
jgi:RNA polymerase sigma-B factor